MKTQLVKLALRLSQRYLSNRFVPWGKRWYWHRVCIPWLSWRAEEIECRTREGLRFLVRPNDFVENRLCFFRTWEPTITELIKRLVLPGDRVLDVGANVGYYSVLCAKLVGREGRVYAVEASPSIRQRLDRNLKLNAISNVSVLPYAAWDGPGQATLYLQPGNRGSSTLSERGNADASETVELVRLDDVLSRADAGQIRLIKMDIEGAELHALRGLRGLLQSNRDVNVICELTPHRLNALGGTAAELLMLLQELGFDGYLIDNDYQAEAYMATRPQLILAPARAGAVAPADMLFCRRVPAGIPVAGHPA